MGRRFIEIICILKIKKNSPKCKNIAQLLLIPQMYYGHIIKIQKFHHYSIRSFKRTNKGKNFIECGKLGTKSPTKNRPVVDLS